MDRRWRRSPFTGPVAIRPKVTSEHYLPRVRSLYSGSGQESCKGPLQSRLDEGESAVPSLPRP
eukprot:3001492-Pyramimonas_sp.AAC.1